MTSGDEHGEWCGVLGSCPLLFVFPARRVRATLGFMATLETESVDVPREEGHFLRRVVVAAVIVVVLVLGFFIGSAVIPRWWAQRISNVIDGRIVFGSFLGIVFGFLFTFLPLVLLRLGLRFRKGRRRALALVAAAVALAAPNLATLGIVLGSGDAAHAGERILDVDGPGFRGGSLVGAILGGLAALGLAWLVRSRRKNKERAAELRAELADLE
jgi:MFS family permease